jgi:A/G-specific adenine glycosylase
MDPYAIAVAEIMLQQTQVDRVLPVYLTWLKKWPDWKSLASASNRQLLTAWSGLGYNRRAVYLGKLAREVVIGYGGSLPDAPDILMTLPGIGRYTAHAILVFAFNRPLAAIDTNIRRVILHEFNLPADLSYAELEQIALRLLPRGKARDWHNALMDYGRLRLPRKIASHPPISRQSSFTGSIRQIRGEIIRCLTQQHRVSLARIARQMQRSSADVLTAAKALEKEGLVTIGAVYVTLSGTVSKTKRTR